MKKVAVAAAVLAVAAALPASAQVKPEDQIKLRKSAYALMGANFASLAAMAQGKKPYNKDEAARNANLVATLADVPIVPVTHFRSTRTSTGRDEVADVLAGGSKRYEALELVASEADAVLGALGLERPTDPRRLILAPDADGLGKEHVGTRIAREPAPTGGGVTVRIANAWRR